MLRRILEPRMDEFLRAFACWERSPHRTALPHDPEIFLLDLALYRLTASPGFTLVAFLSLALGICAMSEINGHRPPANRSDLAGVNC